jgi:hypothetical protein
MPRITDSTKIRPIQNDHFRFGSSITVMTPRMVARGNAWHPR